MYLLCSDMVNKLLSLQCFQPGSFAKVKLQIGPCPCVEKREPFRDNGSSFSRAEAGPMPVTRRVRSLVTRIGVTTWLAAAKLGRLRYDTIWDAILTCARKPTSVSLIYRTETTTKNCKTEKIKSKRRHVLRSNSKSLCSVGLCAVNTPSGKKKGKGSPYSITKRRVPELIPVLGSQPASGVSHKPGSRLQLLSARPAVTPATLKQAVTNFAAWWTEPQWVWAVCLRLLPDSVAAAIWTQALLRPSPAR